MDTPTPANDGFLEWLEGDRMPKRLAPAPAVSGQTPTFGLGDEQMRTPAEQLAQEEINRNLSSAPVASAPKDETTSSDEQITALALIDKWRKYLDADLSHRVKEGEIGADSRGWFLTGRAEGFKTCADDLEATERMEPSRKAQKEGRFFSRERVDEVVLLLREAEKALVDVGARDRAKLVADFAEILSHERSTPARPRDPVSSSSDSSSVHSARTVTRRIKSAINNYCSHPVDGSGTCKCDVIAVDVMEIVSPLLTALAAHDKEITKLKSDVTWWQTSRENLAEALSETIDEHAEMQQTVIANRIKIDALSAALAECAKEIAWLKEEQHLEATELKVQIATLAARAEAAEATLRDAPKCPIGNWTQADADRWFAAYATWRGRAHIVVSTADAG